MWSLSRQNFTTKFPHANISRSPNWANFNLGGNTELFADVFLVEPTDPLFVEIGTLAIIVQIRNLSRIDADRGLEW